MLELQGTNTGGRQTEYKATKEGLKCIHSVYDVGLVRHTFPGPRHFQLCSSCNQEWCWPGNEAGLGMRLAWERGWPGNEAGLGMRLAWE